jgi:hypothetical protein
MSCQNCEETEDVLSAYNMYEANPETLRESILYKAKGKYPNKPVSYL